MDKSHVHFELTGAVIGCAMEVHRELGAGFQEVVYQRSLEVEMTQAGLDFGREVEIPIYYKGRQVGLRRVDFLVGDVVSVELKAVGTLDSVHQAQAINYLEAFNFEIGLLINFGGERLEFRRLFNNRYNANRRL
ncbi:MAG: GxxExxY protein [Chloroflexi bacterium]|nr:GxxExxY protein [Chloroflexota bacterium]